MNTLKAYQLGPDITIANSEQAAIAEWESRIGDDWTVYAESDDVIELPGDEQISIWFEDGPDQLGVIFGSALDPATFTWSRDGSRSAKTYSAPAAAWIAQHGAGYLCSSEY